MSAQRCGLELASILLIIGLAACGAEDGSAPAGTPIASVTGSTPEPGSTHGASPADIADAKLEPCPESDKAIPAVSDGLPDVTLPCLGQGPSVRLAGLRGLPMVVNVWASSCAPCVDELPIMGETARLTANRVRFLGIDYQDLRAAGLAMAAATKMGFASVQDPNGNVRSGLQPFVGLPTTLFVRPDGTIAGRTPGPIADGPDLDRKIEQYLGVKVR